MFLLQSKETTRAKMVLYETLSGLFFYFFHFIFVVSSDSQHPVVWLRIFFSVCCLKRTLAGSYFNVCLWIPTLKKIRASPTSKAGGLTKTETYKASCEFAGLLCKILLHTVRSHSDVWENTAYCLQKVQKLSVEQWTLLTLDKTPCWRQSSCAVMALAC